MSKEQAPISPYVFVGIRLADLPIEMRTIIKKRGRAYSQTIITDAIKKVMKIPFMKIENKTRKHPIKDARKIYCFQMKHKLGWSLKDIGESIGGRDHTTIVHNIKTYKNLYETDDNFREIANQIENEIDCSSADLVIEKQTTHEHS